MSSFRARYASGYRPSLAYRIGAYGDGAASATPVPPGTPFSWLTAQDTDLSANSTMTDGAAFGTAKEKGSVGSGGDVSSTGTNRPTWKRVAATGKLNNASSWAFTAASFQFLQSATFTARTAVAMVGVIFKANNLTSTYFIYDGQTNGRSGLDVVSTSGALQITGAGTLNAGLSITAGSYNMVIVSYNGASSVARLNGTAGSAGNPTAQAINGTVLGAFVGGGGGFFDGEIVERICYDDLSGVNASVTAQSIEAYFTAMYGTFGATGQ